MLDYGRSHPKNLVTGQNFRKHGKGSFNEDMLISAPQCSWETKKIHLCNNFDCIVRTFTTVDICMEMTHFCCCFYITWFFWFSVWGMHIWFACSIFYYVYFAQRDWTCFVLSLPSFWPWLGPNPSESRSSGCRSERVLWNLYWSLDVAVWDFSLIMTYSSVPARQTSEPAHTGQPRNRSKSNSHIFIMTFVSALFLYWQVKGKNRTGEYVKPLVGLRANASFTTFLNFVFEFFEFQH